MIHDIHGLKVIEHFRYPLWYDAVLIGALALLIFFVWSFYKKRRRVQPAVVVETSTRAADEVALEALTRLKKGDDFKEGHERHFHFRLSEIFRHYLEGRFHFHASDLTTEEIIARLSLLQNLSLSAEQKEMIRRVLEEMDGVKFASDRLGREAGLFLLEEIESFVQKTRESLVTV